MCQPVQLVEPAGPQPWARVTWESWSTLRALGLGPSSHGRAGRTRVTSSKCPSTSHPGQVVNHAGTRTLAQFARDSWSNPRALGPDRESSGTAGGHLVNSDMGASRPGQLVDPAGLWTTTHVAQDSRSTPQSLGPGPESPGTAGRHRGSSDPARVPRDSWSNPWAIRHGTDSPRTAGRPRRISGTGPSCPGVLVYSAGHRPEHKSPGMLVNTAGPRTQTRVARGMRSSPHGLGHED